MAELDESNIPRNAVGIQQQLDFTQKRAAGASAFLGSPEWAEVAREIERKMVTDGVRPNVAANLVDNLNLNRKKASEFIQAANQHVAAMIETFDFIRDKARLARESVDRTEFEL